MIGVFPVLYLGWKMVHKTRIHKPEEVDLQRDLDVIESYEQSYVAQPPR